MRAPRELSVGIGPTRVRRGVDISCLIIPRASPRGDGGTAAEQLRHIGEPSSTTAYVHARPPVVQGVVAVLNAEGAVEATGPEASMRLGPR